MTSKRVKQAALKDMPNDFRLGAMGNLGLNVFNGVTVEEAITDLNYPNSLKTFREMSYHSAVNSPLTLYTTLASKANWKFKPPENATEDEKEQCRIVQTMMKDMEHPWREFIKDVLTMNVYGFSVHEKIYRRRNKQNGSAYDDGYIGWKKLSIRAQESIEKFKFDQEGNDVIAVEQNLGRLRDPYGRLSNRDKLKVEIPRSKFLHFKAGISRGDPYGKSPLRHAYLAWKYLIALEDLEATGVSKDLVGLPVLFIPPQYLSADASPEQVAVRNYYENAMRNLQMNQQSAMILPNAFDAETRQPLFDFKLMSVDGKKSYDINKIKEYYKVLIFTSLFADVLIMGQSSTGSFALGSIKNSLSGAFIKSMLDDIKEVLNQDLIKQTYILNSWDYSRAGTLDYDDLEEADLESISKFFQRVGSVGLIEKDRAVLNSIRVAAGVDALPEDLPPQENLLMPETSRAGDGMATAGEGTSTSVSGQDTTSNNLDNGA